MSAVVQLNSTPRWAHKCPSCNRVVMWRRVFCSKCIATSPHLKNFTLAPTQRWLKGIRLRGVPGSVARFIILPLEICFECGRDISKSLFHKCFTVGTPTNYIKSRYIYCTVCKEYKWPTQFPRVEGGKIIGRICSSCLPGRSVAEVKKVER